MVYPITLPDKLARGVQAIAARKGKRADQVIREAVQDLVRQEAAAQSELERSRQLHARIKANLRKRNPALKQTMSRRALVKQMERLSAKAARKLPFATWQQAQSFARGEDHYDFVRQQHISH
jgi:predicted transcriptional regulator